MISSAGVSMFHSRSLSFRTITALVAIGFCSLIAFGQEATKKDRQPTQTAPKAATKTPPKTEPKPPADDAAAPVSKPANVADPADLEAFFDGAINVQLESKHIAGAVVAVVVGDGPVFMKGYGYADIDARTRVDPKKTMFRIASISKLFTWTAVMQQLEEGKVDLNTDVNKYLKDVKVPATFEEPITLKHLLTHTPGFDDYVIGLFAHKVEELRPLAEVLRTQMPTRVRRPDKLSSYSNHGTAIAGQVVACVSGMTWEDYVEQRILKPLDMQHTLVRQPASDKLPAELSKGYKWEDGRFEAKDFEYVPAAPAGCISTTAADAAKFMLAHLRDGQGAKGRILKTETARKMRERLFWHDEKCSAMCYGFMEQKRDDGLRMVGHGGDTLWFHSLLQLIPDRHVGVFVSYNTDTSGGARDVMFDAFLKRYFPEPDPPRIKAAGDFSERVKKLVGEYGMTRYSHSTLTKLLTLVAVFKVTANDDDTLTVRIGDRSTRYVEVEPLVFRELDGPRRIIFKEDENGLNLFLADVPPLSAIRRHWYERSDVHWGLLAGCGGAFASALLFWPALAFTVRRLQSPRIKRTWFSAFLSCVAWLLSLVSIAFAAAFAFAMSEPSEIGFGLTPLVKGVLAMTQVCAVLAALTVLGCVIAWTNRYWRFTGRLHYTLVALAGIGFVWFLYYWNLLTFGFAGLV
jgi:CubicO group peptidase (beta-lactamase class C family)